MAAVALHGEDTGAEIGVPFGIRATGDPVRANRAGMPDLIQFWPAERRYRMIEVKGPGDRLQDNQKRWLAFCAQHGMPVDVCYVRWSEA